MAGTDELAKKLNRSGLSKGTLDRIADDSRAMRDYEVPFLAEATGLPESFFTAEQPVPPDTPATEEIGKVIQAAVQSALASVLTEINAQLAAQTAVLSEIQTMLGKDTAAAERMDGVSETLDSVVDRLDAAAKQTLANLQATAPAKPRAAKPDPGHAPRRKAPAAKKTAPKGSPRATS